MQESWPDIVDRYKRPIASKAGLDGFILSLTSLGALSNKIATAGLDGRLFGWPSMHDLCIQQIDKPPYSCPYLRLSPLNSGEIKFEYVDTPIIALQWRRTVVANQAAQQFVRFLKELKWLDDRSAAEILNG